MAQIITYRKSGLSLNHIIGCPLNCGYCVRHFWGDFEHKTPHLLCTTDEAIGLLLSHEAFRPSTTPIQIFNKATDPFLPAVKPHLFQVLRALDERGLDNLVLVITRFKVTTADMAHLEQLRHVRVTLLFTYSGINDPRIEPIAKSAITTTSIATACTRKERTKVVLYWRPIVPGWNDQPETMGHVLNIGDPADAIVFTGYYHKAERRLPRQPRRRHPLRDQYNRRKVLPPNWSPGRRRLARVRNHHAAVPQDLLRRLVRPPRRGLQRALGRPRTMRHLSRHQADRGRTAPPAHSARSSRPYSQASAIPAGTSSTTGTSGHTASASNAATPSSTPCAIRSGNSTSPISSTPTDDPSPDTSPPRKNKATRRSSPPVHRTTRLMKTTSQRKREGSIRDVLERCAAGRAGPRRQRRPRP